MFSEVRIAESWLPTGQDKILLLWFVECHPVHLLIKWFHGSVQNPCKGWEMQGA